MTDTFQRDGVRFAYPPDWQLETETAHLPKPKKPAKPKPAT